MQKLAKACAPCAHLNKLQPIADVQVHARVLYKRLVVKAWGGMWHASSSAPHSPQPRPGSTSATPAPTRGQTRPGTTGGETASWGPLERSDAGTRLGHHSVDLSAVDALHARVARDLAHYATVAAANLRCVQPSAEHLHKGAPAWHENAPPTLGATARSVSTAEGAPSSPACRVERGCQQRSPVRARALRAW